MSELLKIKADVLVNRSQIVKVTNHTQAAGQWLVELVLTGGAGSVQVRGEEAERLWAYLSRQVTQPEPPTFEQGKRPRI
jgi:hypothetical protein